MAEKRPLRLLVVGSSWPSQTFLVRLMRGLADAKVEVTVSLGRRPDEEWFFGSGLVWLNAPRWSGSAPVRIVRLVWMWVRALVEAPRDLWLFSIHAGKGLDAGARLQRLNRLLPYAGRRWDVIYFPWNFTAIEYLPLFDLGCPVVVSCRGSQINVTPHDPRRTAIRGGLRATLQKAAALHCVSEAILRESVTYGLDPGKAVVIPPSVDSEFFRPAQSPRVEDGTFRVITTGSLRWRKGYEYALLTIRRLLESGIPVRFVIMGDGPERQRVLYTAYDLGLEDCVNLLGQLTPAEVRDHLQQADVFLLSSVSEGLSNAVLEAMACGLPVVTTDCGGMREAVTDGVEGFVVAVRDSEGMARALSVLASDAELRQRMGQAARERVLKQFTPRRQIEEFVAMLEDVARCQVG